MLPEYQSHEEFQNRSKKLSEIRSLGVDPYPPHYSPTHTPQKIHEDFKDQDVGHSEDATLGKTPVVRVAGRLVLFRAMGKNVFAQIQDETGRLQIMFNRDHTQVVGYDPKKSADGLSHMKFLEKKIDLGDILGIEGNIFRTQTGELTVFAKQVTLLCKTLLPLPDKHSGLADKGVRYRKRWLDLIANKEALDKLILRSKIIEAVRECLHEGGFLEVETAILQNSYGGAEASPFTTELNALHQEMFLRISLEIALKKLIVGGQLKVFEIGKVFRNEGIDRTHNPEFTELEGYAAYWDYNDVMSFVENLFEKVALKVLGTTKVKFDIDGKIGEIDFKAPWKRLTMKEAIKKYGNVDVDAFSDEKLKEIVATQTAVKDVTKLTRGSLIATLFEELAESHLIEPHHITDHPIETTPLCKPHRDPKCRKEGLVERFESFVLGSEIANAYTELNDPEMQRQLLEDQIKSKELRGEKDIPPLDEDFIEAICQGMPPTGGFGIGIDRMVMLFTSSSSIKDVIYFPLMTVEHN